MSRSILLSFLMAILFAGCMKDELPVPAHPRGGATEGQACIGADYGQQLWYDVGSNTITASNSKFAWDLAFESGASGWRVRLNGAHFMRAHVAAQNDITQPSDTTGFGAEWPVDLPSGHADSTAIGDWRVEQPVYVLNMGYDANGLSLGLKKLRVLTVSNTEYTFELANLDGSGTASYSVQKDPSRSHVHFHIGSGEQVTIGPSAGAYDLVFTQYTTQFYDPFQAYLVTGAVSLGSGLRTAELVTDDFAAVSLADTLAHPFSVREDAVGYDWKEYSFETSSYVIFASHVFIVQDAEGFFYKLHFIDFYDDLGQRGCPKFEVVAL